MRVEVWITPNYNHSPAPCFSFSLVFFALAPAPTAAAVADVGLYLSVCAHLQAMFLDPLQRQIALPPFLGELVDVSMLGNGVK